MSEISKQQLIAIMNHASEESIERYLPALNEELPKFGIDSPIRVSHFIAQTAHESGSFKHSIENLNYSAAALRGVFGKYFTSDEMAEEYQRKPESIANIVYAGRMGNGDTESGDGWRYRGRGLIQLTGKDNYALCGNAIGIDLLNCPEKVSDDPSVSIAAACWYWNSRGINKAADLDDVLTVTKKINGGTHGLEDRTTFLNRCKATFNIE